MNVPKLGGERHHATHVASMWHNVWNLKLWCTIVAMYEEFEAHFLKARSEVPFRLDLYLARR